jgi:peptidoglycan/LPS O-acetylase OafA/YrhL
MLRGGLPEINNQQIFGLLFGILILNLAANDRLKFSLESPPLKYLGRISYGLYMYHPVAISLALYFTRQSGIASNWLLYPVVLGTTILIASISFHWYELYFLRLKPR